MRPWLVVVGIVFLTLGSGIVAALYFGGPGSLATATVPTGPFRFALGHNGSDTLTLQGVNGSSEQFQFRWHSSSSLYVTLQSPQGCAKPGGPCWNTETFATWPANLSGAWSGSGPFHYPLICILKNNQATAANVTISGLASAQSRASLSVPFEILLSAGAAALFTVGGLAIFLGLFLASDPYGPRPPLVSQSADDVEELTREAGPPH